MTDAPDPAPLPRAATPSATETIIQLVTARSLNTFGRAILSTTVFWELYRRTGTELAISAVGLAQVIPVIALFVPAGELIDRSDRRVLATLSAAMTGAIGVGLALLSKFSAPVAFYYVLLLAQGCATVIHAPAVSSLVPLIIPREELTRANRISASAQELALIIGPGLAGIALSVVSAFWVYAALAVTGVTAGVLYQLLPKPREVRDAVPNARKDWRVGLRYIFRSRRLLPALTLDMFAVLFAGVTALLPVIATDVLKVGPVGYGMLRAAEPVGAVAMAVLGGRLPPWKRPGRVLLIVVSLFGLATIGFGLSTWFPLSLALLVLCGALDNISVVIRLTTEQMVVPDAIRGRVSSVHYVFISMSNELGGSESGAAAYLFGPVPAIVGGGALAMVVCGIVAARWREFVDMPPLAELKPESLDDAGSAG